MPRTPETLVRHELVGSDVRVTAASNPDLDGIEGTVVRETTKTLHVERGARAWQVPKAAATFDFEIDGQRVRIDGERLLARPARRTEQTGDSTWR